MNRYTDPEIEFALLAEKPIDIRPFLMKYLSHWKWFLISFASFCALGVLYLIYTVPTYKVETSILFKDDTRGGASELNVLKDMGLITRRSNVDNEIEVLKKSMIIEEVVREMGLYINYSEYKTFSFLENNKLGDILPGFIKHRKAILYGEEAPFIIHFSDISASNIDKPIIFDVFLNSKNDYQIAGKFNGEKYAVQVSPADSIINMPFGKIGIERNKNSQKGIERHIRVSISNPFGTAMSYQNAMKIELTSKTSSVANISLTSPNGNLGKDFLKNYIEAYNEKGIRDQIELADKTSKVIEDHLSQLSGELSSVETQAQDYKQSKGLTNITSQADIYNTQSANVRQRQIDIESQLSIISNINRQVQSITEHSQLIPAGSGITNTFLNTQIESYNKLVMERNRLSRIASSSNQSMIDLNKRIESTYSSLRSGLQNEQNNLEIQLQDLSSMLSQNYARLRAIPQQEREYSDIVRQQSVKEALFVYLLQKKEEKYMNMASVTPNSKLIDNIYIKGVASPNLMITAIIFLALGFFVPIFIITVQNLLRYQIVTKSEIENMSSIPVLGELPKIEQSNKILIHENNNDTFNELMRLIRTNLLFVSGNHDKVINILSSISGEGKTLITANLAKSIALLDKKVLIIELDIRRPKMSQLLDINNENGITLYLSGQIGKDELIIPSEAHENLWFIPSGPIPPNPNELLAKPELDFLIEELKNQFDYILIDTAPIGIVSDSFLLDRICDINLYVTRSEFTPKKYIEEAEQYSKEGKLKKIYFVLNSIDLNKAHYGYGKKYTYGYN